MNRMVLKKHSVESPVTYVFTMHLRTHDHTKFTFNFPLYSLQMNFKGTHNFMVMALGHSVKWPLLTIITEQQGVLTEAKIKNTAVY
jgi:hypothetical protein